MLRAIGASRMEVLKQLPDSPDLDHLKKQAKDLLAAFKSGDPIAFARFRASLPAASAKDDQAIKNLALRLHDARSCLAREYGFPSWTELGRYIAARRASSGNRAESILNWLRLIYPVTSAAEGTGQARSLPPACSKNNPNCPEAMPPATPAGNTAIRRHGMQHAHQASPAHRTASAPAGMRIGLDGSVAARHTASATSTDRVISVDSAHPSKMRCAKPA